MKAGKAFEQLTTAIQQHVNSNADVVPNAPLTDICGIQREIDVLVTIPTPSGKQEIAFECRDHKRKVGVFDIDSFISKYHDLPQINKLVVVSNSGFTKSAKLKAQSHNIELHLLNNVPYQEILKIVDVSRLRCKIEIPLPFYLVVGEKNLFMPYLGQKVYDMTNDAEIQLEGEIITSFLERVSSLEDQLKSRNTNTAQLPYSFVPSEKWYILDSDNNKHIIKLCCAIIDVSMNSCSLDVSEQKLYAANGVRVSRYAQTDGNSLLLVNDENKCSAFLQNKEETIRRAEVVPQK